MFRWRHHSKSIKRLAIIQTMKHQELISPLDNRYSQKIVELANNDYITPTDLADYLVKNNSLSFRKAYQKTAGIVNLAEKKKKNLNELSLDEMKKIIQGLKGDVFKVFDLKNSVNSKKSYGGTSFDNIKKMIMKYKKTK